MGRVAAPKTGQKNALPRENATEAPVGRVAVPKTGQKNALPREDATEMLEGMVAVLRTASRVEVSISGAVISVCIFFMTKIAF